MCSLHFTCAQTRRSSRGSLLTGVPRIEAFSKWTLSFAIALETGFPSVPTKIDCVSGCTVVTAITSTVLFTFDNTLKLCWCYSCRSCVMNQVLVKLFFFSFVSFIGHCICRIAFKSGAGGAWLIGLRVWVRMVYI